MPKSVGELTTRNYEERKFRRSNEFRCHGKMLKVVETVDVSLNFGGEMFFWE